MLNEEVTVVSIDSESKFLWQFVWHLLLTPFMFFLVLFGKRPAEVLWRPVSDITQYVTSAKTTFWLIIVNVACYIGSLFVLESTVKNLLLYPSDIVHPNRWYSFFTAGFLHANLAHLGWNMLALFIAGRVVERRLGGGKTVLVYLVALLSSSVLSASIDYFFMHSATPSLGASGAIAGLISAALLLDPFYVTFELLVPLPFMLVGWLTLFNDLTNYFKLTNDGINHLAHLGGYFSVIIVVFLVDTEDRQVLKRGLLINLAALASIGAAYLYFVR